MTSTDDDQRAEVWRLRQRGETIRSIAERLGLSKSKVGRMAADDDGDGYGVEYADADDLDDDDDAELARLEALDSGQSVTEPVRYVGVETTVADVKGWDSPQVSRELRYVDAAGRSLSVLDVYRYTEALQAAGKWIEAEELTAALDRQHSEDPELELTFDMLGTNPTYEPRESDAVDRRWTVMGPS